MSGGAGLGQALGDALGSPVVRWSGLSGGDINQAAQIALRDGRELFVKSNASAPPGMFAAEARGLAWLAEARALRLPEVVAVSARDADVQFLVLELIRPATRAGAAGADFVQKQRAAVGFFKEPLLVHDRAGEGSADMAEQLALQQGV